MEGTSVGTTTDAAGHFSIAAPSNGQLNVSFIGYKDAFVAVAGQTKLEITLDDDHTAIDDVVIVAFGSKRKQDLVGSVSAVKKDLIQNAQTASISSALEGAVAGLSLVSSTGQPGEDASIYLRGLGSLSGSNAALIVVDGVPFNGKLSDINPQDIASISVSKDAVSNSLYGSRAAGGVIMVTTKTGGHDKVRVNFQGSWGVSQRAYKDYDMTTDPGEFYRLTWYGLRNTQWAGGASIDEANLYASQNLLKVVDNYNSFIIPEGEYIVNTDGTLNPNRKVRYNDTFADALFNTAFRQEYTVSASGGSKSTDYYMSVGYLDNDSYILGSSFNRFSARANVNSQLRKWLKMGTNIAYSRTVQNGVKELKGYASNPFAVARGWAPIYPVHAYDAAGNLKYDSNGKPMYDSGRGETDGSSLRKAGMDENVVASMKEDIIRDQYHNLTTRSYAEIRFLKDFTFTVNYSYDYTNDNATTYYMPLLGDGRAFNGRGYRYGINYMTTNFSQILAYDKYFGKDKLHNISAKAGHEYYQYKLSYFSGSKTRFFDPSNPELSNGGEMQSINSYNQSHNIEGFFAMADYNYAHKYYVSASYRADGTSRFLNRWGHFWSVGASWRISAEKWMQGASSWLNDLKLRASYGTQGNENVLNYTPYQDQYEVVWDGSSFGYAPTFYGNPNLTWEKQATVDIGLDFKLFNVVYGSVEWYSRKTTDMLFSRKLADSNGRPYNWENVGAMRNSGVEFELNFDIFKKHDLQWTVSLVGSHYNNVLVTLPEEYRAEGMSAGNFKRMEGHSIYEYYICQYAGFDKETGEAMWYKDDYDDDKNVIGRTTTKNHNEATQYLIGKTALPDFQGGLSTSFYWKGIDVSIATAFQIGGWAYDYDYVSSMNMSNYYVNHNRDLWNTWNPETKSGKYPIWNANGSSKYTSAMSDALLVKASYFSLRNVTVGYSFPKTWMKKLGIEGIRVYFTADNVALKSARQGFDPRTSTSGSNSSYAGYAPLRTISGGLNLTF
ncbi:MAG: SusC/RagA family TonB-linked outer membrane protein [Alistipes sp.]|nr:SusC/RagA family TonB-linked outer membrane protein [Alistipes sp.]